MLVMDGLDAACAIRKKLSDARIVIFALYSDNLGELLARAAAVNLLISKTEGAAGLLHTLEPLLARDSRPCSAN